LAKPPSWTAKGSDFGVTVSLPVDTTVVRFRAEPRYLANVVGERSVSIDSGKTRLFLDGFVSLDKTNRGGFVLSMLIPATLLGGAKIDDAVKALPDAIAGWSVEWVGVEG
jgi:hypothetical protein